MTRRVSTSGVKGVDLDAQPNSLASRGLRRRFRRPFRHQRGARSSSSTSMIARQLAFPADCAAKLTEEDRAYRSALSPVRRLPLEVLGEIFKLVVPSFLNASDREMMGNMGRVCQRWRDAFLNVSSLWRGIILGPCLCPVQDTVGAVRRHEEHVYSIRWSIQNPCSPFLAQSPTVSRSAQRAIV
ncbi:hypothetical protein DFP72DRAFT_927400 [Ephemerocybe angulata]|uniref:F-box domain-containing protein n=1 Tax=Ephemerocybe angulata TaxID=980116 RepID=A0A8H6HET3_9AGAR|nr:hypothetical protein DFP72DRAFT_927400 [Tulosesus angulatus]